MTEAKLTIVNREPNERARVLALQGVIGREAQEPLMAAWQEASGSGAGTIVLNFDQVEGMDSVGLGLLIALLAKAEQQKQRLVACGLSASLQRAFQVTYLNEVLPVFADEAEALQNV